MVSPMVWDPCRSGRALAEAPAMPAVLPAPPAEPVEDRGQKMVVKHGLNFITEIHCYTVKQTWRLQQTWSINEDLPSKIKTWPSKRMMVDSKAVTGDYKDQEDSEHSKHVSCETLLHKRHQCSTRYMHVFDHPITLRNKLPSGKQT